MTPQTPARGPFVVGIPTYRRPELLRRLLVSLARELRDQPAVTVIVADNECAETAPAVLAAMRVHFDDLRLIAVPERGLAAVRNAIVSAAYTHVPEWRWLLMLDDDGEVQPGWFLALTGVAQQTDAHATGGAVVCPLPAGAGIFARNSEFALRARFPTGTVAMLGVGQNVCVSRQVESLLTRPWFDAKYGSSGGEDYDFFRRIRRAGGRFAWADEALVVEPQPAERLTTRSVLYRSLTTGVTTAGIDRRFDGAAAVAMRTVHLGAMALGSLLVNGLTFRRDRVVRALIGVAFVAGRLPGVARLTAPRYAASDVGPVPGSHARIDRS